MTKSDITKALKETERAGWTWKTFNSRWAMPTGCAGFPDHFGVHSASGRFLFIEVKLNRDTLSDLQSDYGRELHRACLTNGGAEYILFPCEAFKTKEELIDYILKT